jgi:hypothetical protein
MIKIVHGLKQHVEKSKLSKHMFHCENEYIHNCKVATIVYVLIEIIFTIFLLFS